MTGPDPTNKVTETVALDSCGVTAMVRESWFDGRDLAERKRIADQIQLQALDSVPYLPLGQVFLPTAFRSDIKDIVKATLPLFWNVRRG